jgi:predicted dienelactone hydrolase
VRTITVVDPTRPTKGNPARNIPASSSRTLPVMLLYPAAGPAGDATPKQDAAVADGQFPIVEFSHGVTASGPAYTPLLEHWAAAGFVIAAPTFPMTAGGGGWDDIKDYQNQPADVRVVLDHVIALNKAANEPLKGHLDTTDIAVAGHSLGAITTLGFYNSCCPDPRVKAMIAISGVMLPFPNGSYDHLPSGPPILLIHGGKDKTVPYASSQASFDNLPGPRAFLSVPGANHTGVLSPERQPSVTSDVAIAFLDLELRHDAGPWKAAGNEVKQRGVATLAVRGGLPSPG